MKKYFFMLATIGLFAACSSADKKATTTDSTGKMVSKNGDGSGLANDTAAVTTLQWLDSTRLELGEQKEGKEIEISYRFKNTGDKYLVIQNVSAQCGCTIPEKPKEPFAPGAEGVIKAKYNGSGHGEVSKEIYVTANTTPANHTLTFHAQLIK